MNFGRISALLLRQFYLIRDNPTRLNAIFIWVLLDIVLWGFISKFVSDVSGISFAPLFLGGILLWDFLIRVMHGITMAFFEDVWSRNFLNVFASPLSTGEYITGLVLSSVGTSVLGLIAMILLAGVVFGLQFAIYGFSLLLFLLILFLSGITLGILGVAIVLRLGPAAEWFIWPIPAMIAPFVGVFYPLNTLPEWMQTIGLFLPPSYVFEGMRAVVAGQGIPTLTFLIGFGLAILQVAGAYLFFRYVYALARRSGLLARYSAETVT